MLWVVYAPFDEDLPMIDCGEVASEGDAWAMLPFTMEDGYLIVM